MSTPHPSVSPDYELIESYRGDCQRHFWTGFAIGAAIVGLLWGIYLIP